MIKTREWAVRAMKHKNGWLMVPIVLLMISALFLSTIIVSAVVATGVTVQPASQKVGIGDTFTVNIFVNPVTSICGVQCQLYFNPAVVTANGATEGNLLNQNADPTLFSPGTIYNGAGNITNIFGLITAPSKSVSNNGTFATVSFTATAVGTSAIDLSNVKVGNTTPAWVPVTVTGGSVTVYPDWDVNRDGHANGGDLVLVGSQFGKTGAAHWIPEDADRSGEIDILDMILIVQHWTG